MARRGREVGGACGVSVCALAAATALTAAVAAWGCARWKARGPLRYMSRPLRAGFGPVGTGGGWAPGFGGPGTCALLDDEEEEEEEER